MRGGEEEEIRQGTADLITSEEYHGFIAGGNGEEE